MGKHQPYTHKQYHAHHIPMSISKQINKMKIEATQLQTARQQTREATQESIPFTIHK